MSDAIFRIYDIQSVSLPEEVKFNVLKNVFENLRFRHWIPLPGDGDIVMTDLRVEEDDDFRFNIGDYSVLLEEHGEEHTNFHGRRIPPYRMKLIHVIQNMIHRNVHNKSETAPIRKMLLQEIQAQKSNQRDIQNRSLRLGIADIFRKKKLPKDIVDLYSGYQRRKRSKPIRKQSKHKARTRRRIRSSYKKKK